MSCFSDTFQQLSRVRRYKTNICSLTSFVMQMRKFISIKLDPRLFQKFLDEKNSLAF